MLLLNRRLVKSRATNFFWWREYFFCSVFERCSNGRQKRELHSYIALFIDRRREREREKKQVIEGCYVSRTLFLVSSCTCFELASLFSQSLCSIYNIWVASLSKRFCYRIRRITENTTVEISPFIAQVSIWKQPTLFFPLQFFFSSSPLQLSSQLNKMVLRLLPSIHLTCIVFLLSESTNRHICMHRVMQIYGNRRQWQLLHPNYGTYNFPVQ